MIRVFGDGYLVKPHPNASKAVELTDLPSGTVVGKLRLRSSNKKVKGEWTSLFIDMEIWEGLATNAASSLHAGDHIVFTGALQNEEWESKKDGSKRVTWKIRADSLGSSLAWATTTAERAEREPELAVAPVQQQWAAGEEPF
jgi:single-stranded DNA-binding protein